MTMHDFIFTKKSPGKYYRHIIFWVAQYVFWTFWATGFYMSLIELLKFGLRLNGAFILHAIYTYLIVYYYSPKYLETKKYKKFIYAVFFITLFSYILFVSYMIGIFYGFDIYFKQFKQHSEHEQLLMTWYFSMNFIINGPPAVCAMFLCCKMLKNYYIKIEERQMLIKENAQAEMQLLKAQVHPHFLFNTLNNIYAFTLNKSTQAPQLVMNLADTLRYMIQDCAADMVSLEQELKMISNYIDLEKIRYGDRLDFTMEISGDTEGKKIVPLLMIPFIENSFKHGASRILRSAWIKLFIQADENILHFTLSNNKPSTQSNTEKGGIGLTNVQKRLELLYPNEHLLTIECTTHTFTVNMQIPLIKFQNKIVA